MYWNLRSKQIDETVAAETSEEAFNALRSRPIDDFGIIVGAVPVGGNVEDDEICIRTSMLMYRWKRPDDARRCVKTAIAMGLPNTDSDDRKELRIR